MILVTLGSTRADHLGSYGYQRGITPRIDRFAADAVVYRLAWSTAPSTLPAHASILTGMFPTTHGAHFDVRRNAADRGELTDDPMVGALGVNRLREDVVTLAELLKGDGYATAAFAGGPWLVPPFGLLQGYDEQDFSGIARDGGRPADELTDRAIAWIGAQPRARPLHVLLNYHDPHWPYDPPPGYDRLPRARRPVDPSVFVRVNRGEEPLPARQRAIGVDRYDGEIAFMDHHFGRLLDALRDVGRYEHALIVLVADHGESFGEHQLVGHGLSLYEDVLRVPLIVRYPEDLGAGSVEDTPVSVVDLLLLVAMEVGLTLPPGLEGLPVGERHLVFMESSRDARAVSAFGPRFDRDLRAVVSWPWKMILSDHAAPELYDLSDDPGEHGNQVGIRRGIEIDMRNTVIAAGAALRPPSMIETPRDVAPDIQKRLGPLGHVE